MALSSGNPFIFTTPFRVLYYVYDVVRGFMRTIKKANQTTLVSLDLLNRYRFYKKIYLQINNTVSTYIRGVSFLNLPQIKLMSV